MAKGRGDFADILLKKKLIGVDQLAEAESSAGATGMKLQDAIIKLQYLSANGVSERVIIEMNNTRNRTTTRIVGEPTHTRTVIVREPSPYYYDPYFPQPVYVRPASGVYIRGRF